MLNTFERVVQIITSFTAKGAQLAMVIAMGIIVSNVILRIPWRPVPGSVELVEMAGAVLLALGVAYTAIMKNHIMVGVLVERFSPRVQGMVEIVVNIIALFFSYLLAREILFYAIHMMERGYETGHLKLPIAPAIFLVAFGFVMLAMVLLLDLFKAIKFVMKGSETA